MKRAAPAFPLSLDRLAPNVRADARETLRPQRLVQQAADDAARRRTPSGLGLDSQTVRERMVERLRADGLTHAEVLNAFARVERHRYVDTALANQAYEDTALPIGHGQTISKPSVIARMLTLAMDGVFAKKHGHLGRVLEIGGGCGYQAALLARLARGVVSIERIGALADKARATLAECGVPRVSALHADGRLGHPRAPYDTIVSAAGGAELPPAWIEQMAVGARLVAPVQRPGTRAQHLIVLDRGPHGVQRREFDAVHFVPLKSGLG